MDKLFEISVTPHLEAIVEAVESGLYKYIGGPKGRRFGATKGFAIQYVLWAISDTRRMLWGDVAYGNIKKYFTRYFEPELNKLGKEFWHWNKQDHELRIANIHTLDPHSPLATIIDFRSADYPASWEGFGYDIIFLNEAGIILHDIDLYEKSILPMMLDNPKSVLIAMGVPKGKKLKDGTTQHPLYTICQKADTGNPRYKKFHFTSYDSPMAATPEGLAELEQQIKDNGGHQHPAVRQEYYGEFIDGAQVPFLHAFRRDKHVKPLTFNPDLDIYLAWDFNIASTCLVIQFDEDGIYVLDEYHQKGIETICWAAENAYQGHYIINGDASGSADNAGNESWYATIKYALNIGWDGNFNIPKANPRHKKSWQQCNYIFEYFPIFIDPRCEELIADCESVEVICDKGKIEIDKSDETRTHWLDPLRYHINSEHWQKVRVYDKREESEE